MTGVGVCVVVLAFVCGLHSTSAGRVPPSVGWNGGPSAPPANGDSTGGTPAAGGSSKEGFLTPAPPAAGGNANGGTPAPAVAGGDSNGGTATNPNPMLVPSGTLGATSIPIFLTEGADLSSLDIETIQNVASSPVSDLGPVLSKNAGGGSATATSASVLTDGAASTAASSSSALSTSNGFCDYRCLQNVSCQPNTPLCQTTIIVAGSVYCRFFSGCPAGRPLFSVVYIPLNPFGRTSGASSSSAFTSKSLDGGAATASLAPADSTSITASGASGLSGGPTAASASSSSTTQASRVGGVDGQTTASASASGGVPEVRVVSTLPELPESLKPLDGGNK
ncbi:hypothetical protein BSKO_14079 [Bryopsis sp. KO-2023]|nr:hypothetical protein BSKO_14079 [Bryopsis sp. KO-2023]